MTVMKEKLTEAINARNNDIKTLISLLDYDTPIEFKDKKR